MASIGYTAIKQNEASQDLENVEERGSKPRRRQRHLEPLRLLTSSTFTYIGICVSVVVLSGFVLSSILLSGLERVPSRRLLSQEAFFPHCEPGHPSFQSLSQSVF